MPWTMGFTDDGRILRVLIEGRLSASEAGEMTQKSVALAAQEQATRIMLDCSKAQLDVPILDVYGLPDLYASRGVSRRVHAAVLLPKDGYRREVYEFYEDVCRNRGYFVRLFEDEDEAWAWLREG